MDAKDVVQLSLLAMGGQIQGKTKLQKTIYFLALIAECLDDLGYRAHFYGPYSEDVADSMGWLRTIGAVDQTSSGVGAVDDSAFEIRRYDFKLNEQGRRFAEATARRHPALKKKLEDAASLLKRAGELDYVKLSVAAKTYFMLRETDGQASESDLARLASRFGWEVTLDQVKDAVAYLRRIGLLTAQEQA